MGSHWLWIYVVLERTLGWNEPKIPFFTEEKFYVLYLSSVEKSEVLRFGSFLEEGNWAHPLCFHAVHCSVICA